MDSMSTPFFYFPPMKHPLTVSMLLNPSTARPFLAEVKRSRLQNPKVAQVENFSVFFLDFHVRRMLAEFTGSEKEEDWFTRLHDMAYPEAGRVQSSSRAPHPISSRKPKPEEREREANAKIPAILPSSTNQYAKKKNFSVSLVAKATKTEQAATKLPATKPSSPAAETAPQGPAPKTETVVDLAYVFAPKIMNEGRAPGTKPEAPFPTMESVAQSKPKNSPTKQEQEEDGARNVLSTLRPDVIVCPLPLSPNQSKPGLALALALAAPDKSAPAASDKPAFAAPEIQIPRYDRNA
jgi:hypothetical protein